MEWYVWFIIFVIFTVASFGPIVGEMLVREYYENKNPNAYIGKHFN